MKKLQTPILAGVILGLLVVGWTLVMGLTGWYLDPDRLHLFWLVVVIQIVVLAVTLLKTRVGRGYRGQVGVGMITSAIAAVIVFIGSALFTTTIFPDYFEDLRAVRERVLREEGMPEAEIEETLDEIAASQTPTGQAFAGFMGTLGTGLAASLVVAAFLREKNQRG